MFNRELAASPLKHRFEHKNFWLVRLAPFLGTGIVSAMSHTSWACSTSHIFTAWGYWLPSCFFFFITLFCTITSKNLLWSFIAFSASFCTLSLTLRPRSIACSFKATFFFLRARFSCNILFA